MFIPYLCTAKGVLLAVIGAQVVAFLVAVISRDAPGWSYVAYVSLYVQWIVLMSMGLWCVIVKRSHHRSVIGLSILCLGATVCVATAVALLSMMLVYERPIFEVLPYTRTQGLVLKSVIAAGLIATVLLRYFYVQYQWQQSVLTAASLQFDALQARIRPHFLFNSFNTIASLIPTEPEQAEQMIEDLSELFRSSLKQGQDQVTLDDEVLLCKRYIELEKNRLGNRLQVNWVLPEDMTMLLPPFVIQPLIENAIYHGIQRLEAGGVVDVCIECQPTRLVMTITNPLPSSTSAQSNQGLQMALDNVHKRLQMYFAGQVSLDTQQTNEDFTVCISIDRSEKRFKHAA